MVELPFLEMMMIWIIRSTEHTVVKSPSTKRPMSATLRGVVICTRTSSGMGSRKMTTSKKMVMAARP